MFGKKWPYYAEDELSAVNHVLRSGKVNYWTALSVLWVWGRVFLGNVGFIAQR
jgi:hypothetical protein